MKREIAALLANARACTGKDTRNFSYPSRAAAQRMRDLVATLADALTETATQLDECELALSHYSSGSSEYFERHTTDGGAERG